MKLHILCIGNEILGGRVLNTNLASLGSLCEEHGWHIERETCVPDDLETIRRETVAALATADVLVTIGGLGPTTDDLTRPAVAAALTLPLQWQPEVAARIRTFLSQRQITIHDEAVNLQAMVPAGAEILPNPNGTAPGLCIPTPSGQLVFLLPGPPHEFMPMARNEMLPRLQARFARTEVADSVFCVGIAESNAAVIAEAVAQRHGGFDIAYCAKPAQVYIRFTTVPERAAALAAAMRDLRQELSAQALPQGCQSVVEGIAQVLAKDGLVMATAESCTGGGIAKAITDLPGASAFFHGAVISYDNAWKTRFLGVPESLLAEPGAVSEAVARAMLQGLLDLKVAQVGIAVTGIAGPTGGTLEKPVGLVYVATGRQEKITVRRYQFAGDREAIRERVVAMALVQLWQGLTAPEAQKH
jgi:nicotinamide-nucleotide amidase